MSSTPEAVARGFCAMVPSSSSKLRNPEEPPPTTPTSVLPPLPSKRRGVTKRALSDSRSTDCVDSASSASSGATTDEDDEDATASSCRGGASKRLRSRCATVVRELELQMNLASCLRRTRETLEARRELAQKSKRLRLSKGLSMLVVLLALKWKSTALREPFLANTAAENVKAKTSVYVRNRAKAACLKRCVAATMAH